MWMNIINRDWRSTYLQAAALILIDTFILTLFLRPVLTKDHLLKIATLVFAFSIVSVLTFYDLNLLPRQKKAGVAKQCALFLMAATHLYMIAVGALQGFLQICVRVINDEFVKERIQNYKNQVVILFSMVFLIFIVIFTLYTFDIFKIISQKHLWICVVIPLFSVLFLFVVSVPLQKMRVSQAVRRKVFHIGPILVIPIIYQLNTRLLILMLTAAFALVFLLQIIRYKQQELDEDHSDVNPFLKKILGGFNVIYQQMGKFNRREKHFWFTHLFLCLSLLFSYQLPQIISHRMKLSPHLVLILIAADASAAIIGSNFGKIKLYDNKTLEGTVAFIIACFACSYFLIPLNITQLAILSIACGIVEHLGGDTDNIVTLLAYYAVRFIFVLIVRLKLV